MIYLFILNKKRFNNINKFVKEENSKALKSQFNEEIERSIKDLNTKFNELNLLKKNIQNNYDYLSIPIILSNHYFALENEIKRRKTFEHVFSHIVSLLKDKFIEKEDEYIKK